MDWYTTEWLKEPENQASIILFLFLLILIAGFNWITKHAPVWSLFLMAALCCVALNYVGYRQTKRALHEAKGFDALRIKREKDRCQAETNAGRAAIYQEPVPFLPTLKNRLKYAAERLGRVAFYWAAMAVVITAYCIEQGYDYKSLILFGSTVFLAFAGMTAGRKVAIAAFEAGK